MKKLMLALIGLAAFWSVTAFTDIPEWHEGMAYREKPQDWYPLAIGNYWIYEGTSKISGNGTVREFNIMERVEVELQVNNGDYSLYICKGHPMDVMGLENYETIKGKQVVEIPGQPCGYLVHGSEVYGIMGSDLDGVKKAIFSEDPPAALSALNVYEDFDFPLIIGKSFSSVVDVERADHWYEWYVKDAVPSAKWQVNGTPGEEYHLMFYTNPDRTDVYFVPGVGITHYVYHHNGTVMDVDLTLKDYHLAGK